MRIKTSITLLLFFVLLIILGSACTPGPEPKGGSTGTAPAAAATAPSIADEITSTPLPTAVQIELTLPPSPTKEPTPSPTLSPTPTATPIHPLTIQWLREKEFPGSEIVIEEQLVNGANYFRYIVSYQSDGLKIRALLTVPFGERPDTGWPVIVFNHGYIPPEIYRTTERYIAYVDGFATNGYIVLRSDYRGHDQSEGEARGTYGNPDYVVDVLNAVTAMKAYEDADPDRIGLWGHSMGGYITLRSMVVDADIKAGVIWAGVVGPYPNLFNRPDFSFEERPDGRGRWRTELLAIFGDQVDNPEFWASISTNTYLDDLSGPIQLHHGTADTSVPYSVSEILYNQVVEIGGSVEFFGYPGDDHNITNGFSLAMQRSIQFFDRYVKGGSP